MPRFSRISWNSREDADPPSIESSSEAANRRRSDLGRPMPPRQTWYCSLVLVWNRISGRDSPIHTGRTPADGSGSLA